MNWQKVEPNPADSDDKPEMLPPLDRVVWIIYLGYDDEPVLSLGGRTDEGEGWLWGRNCGGYHARQWDAEIECDDGYRVTHWAEIEWPE